MNARQILKDFPLFISVKAALLAETLRRQYVRIIAGLLAGFLTPLAHADGDLVDMIKAPLDGIYSLKEPIVKASMTLGLILIAVAIGMMASKKNNPQIKGWHILILFAAGGCLIALDQIANRSQKQMGLNPVSVG
ncbi:DUF6750 family protein [Yersinia enterocolitica]|uniref:Uncharacterized protein n=1 Tax=Yersinia intermedia TaxID=631 RepID=A0A0T9MT15_YERIN|nr:DUF6750 family protein [Yersinia intermedia]EKN6368078.1 hypothetical protein [Yersinia enterocolitica]OVZ88195.1 hypothetical protein CBW58_19835 [Yersinia frederiksenii]CNG45099.1 Uncharacterised protein [Yersinia intermedia]HDL6708947.1 hypothetical protein [Yersinia enterocolitica]